MAPFPSFLISGDPLLNVFRGGGVDLILSELQFSGLCLGPSLTSLGFGHMDSISDHQSTGLDCNSRASPTNVSVRDCLDQCCNLIIHSVSRVLAFPQ